MYFIHYDTVTHFKGGSCSYSAHLLNLDNWIKIRSLMECLHCTGLYQKQKHQTAVLPNLKKKKGMGFVGDICGSGKTSGTRVRP